MVNLNNKADDFLNDLEGLIDYARDSYWKLEIIIKEIYNILKDY